MTNPDVYGGGTPPTIPPVVPVPTAGPSSSMPTGTPPIHHVVPTPIAPSVGPILGVGTGPTLGGVGPLAPTAPVPPISPPVITPTPPPPPGIGAGFPPPLPTMPSGFGTTSPGSFGPNPNAGSLTKPGAGGVANIPRAMPPGGMIGGMSGPALGQPGAAASPARRINPVGGMIGGSTAAGSGMAPMGGSAGQRPVGSAQAAQRPWVATQANGPLPRQAAAPGCVTTMTKLASSGIRTTHGRPTRAWLR